MVANVDQRRHPRRLLPLNRARTAGALLPLAHVTRVVSGDHSPIRVGSPINSQTREGGAAISIETSTSAIS